MKSKLFIFLVFFFFLRSCTPLYTLNVQNNSEKSVIIYVELKTIKNNEKSRKVLEKRLMYNYGRLENIEKLPLDSLNFYNQKNQTVQKKYSFTSDLNYNFELESNLITNIDPNNSISIYPFEKVYYFQNGKKCFIVPINKDKDCSLKVHHKERLKKNKSIISTADFIEIEN